MGVPELNSALVMPLEPRRRASERRTPRDPSPPPPEPEPGSVAPEPGPTPEASFYASLFRADLSALTPYNPQQNEAEATPAALSSPEFFASLGTLIEAVRAGDLGRARAAAEALETEALVDRSAADLAPLKPAAGERAAARLRLVKASQASQPPAGPSAEAAYVALTQYLDADGSTA